jgi:DNA-binding PadR family transcriptional regulator
MNSSQLSIPHSIPLTPAVFHILLALVEGEQHGYRIMQTVSQNSDGQFHMGPGTLYGTIKRMLVDGFIEESGERPDPALDDERRRYYRLTELGKTVLQAEAERLSGLVRRVQELHLIPASRSDKP